MSRLADPEKIKDLVARYNVINQQAAEAREVEQTSG